MERDTTFSGFSMYGARRYDIAATRIRRVVGQLALYRRGPVPVCVPSFLPWLNKDAKEWAHVGAQRWCL